MLLPGFREDVLSLMKSADLFVMSSVTEGLGSAVLDAMAMGHAVVGTRAGGIPEAVVPGETGRAGRTGATRRRWPAAIVKLLKDDALRKQYGEAGRARVAEHFGVDRLVEGTLEVYERVTAALKFIHRLHRLHRCAARLSVARCVAARRIGVEVPRNESAQFRRLISAVLRCRREAGRRPA